MGVQDNDEIVRLSAGDLAEVLENGTDEEIRGFLFELPRDSLRSGQPLFRHQAETLEKVAANGGASGIIHLPTGAGKTRVAIELMARRLRADPTQRTLWVSYPRTLIRQGMARLVELATLFPPGTTFQWVLANVIRDDDLVTRATVTFMMRDDLTGLLEDAADRRVVDAPLVVALGTKRRPGVRVTVIYDECHQLGARLLQRAWRKCDEKYFSSLPPGSVQTIGLSATPLPTSQTANALLRETIFPVGAGRTARPDWHVLVHASIDNESLVRDKILCPVNLTVQEAGTFNIPEDLIVRAGGDRVRSPGRAPTNKDLRLF